MLSVQNTLRIFTLINKNWIQWAVISNTKKNGTNVNLVHMSI